MILYGYDKNNNLISEYREDCLFYFGEWLRKNLSICLVEYRISEKKLTREQEKIFLTTFSKFFGTFKFKSKIDKILKERKVVFDLRKINSFHFYANIIIFRWLQEEKEIIARYFPFEKIEKMKEKTPKKLGNLLSKSFFNGLDIKFSFFLGEHSFWRNTEEMKKGTYLWGRLKKKPKDISLDQRRRFLIYHFFPFFLAENTTEND